MNLHHIDCLFKFKMGYHEMLQPSLAPISRLISGNYHGPFLLQDDPGPCLAAADVVQVSHDGPGHQKGPGRSRHSAILSGETICAI